MEPQSRYYQERDEIEKQITLIQKNLPRRNSRAAVSMVAMIPYKAIDYRECLAWRMFELSRDSLNHLDLCSLASAIILTRAALETTAALWYLNRKIKTVVDCGVVGDIDNYLMKLLVGSKNEKDFPTAINVLTFVDEMNKSIAGFREQYDKLSEFAHPNWAGTTGLYSMPNKEEFCTDFGSGLNHCAAVQIIGAITLNLCLMAFVDAYNSIADMMPEFVRICESELQKKQESGTV